MLASKPREPFKKVPQITQECVQREDSDSDGLSGARPTTPHLKSAQASGSCWLISHTVTEVTRLKQVHGGRAWKRHFSSLGKRRMISGPDYIDFEYMEIKNQREEETTLFFFFLSPLP